MSQPYLLLIERFPLWLDNDFNGQADNLQLCLSLKLLACAEPQSQLEVRA